jgi:hypothetical protein
MIRVALLASGTFSRGRPMYTPAPMAIVADESPPPRTTRARLSQIRLVRAPAKMNGTVPIAASVIPIKTTGRGPILSVIFPANVRGSSEPIPCGAISSPASSALKPRNCW